MNIFYVINLLEMNIINIYNDRILKYPLTCNECEYIDQAWNFLNVFKYNTLYLHQYRDYIINNIVNNYSIDDFVKYENIINKLYWNLRWLLFPLWHNPEITGNEYEQFIVHNYGNYDCIPNYILMYNQKNYSSSNELKEIIRNAKMNDMYYRSFINKLIMIDPEHHQINIKPMEGSSHIFHKNYFNTITSTILTNRELYENIMSEPYSLKAKIHNIVLPSYYYEFDYPFPNLNQCVYCIGNDDYHKYRIQKMYYDSNAEHNWFKIII